MSTLRNDDFATQVQAHIPALLSFARGRLRNPAYVEDAVSDTVLAALEQRNPRGDAQLRTWLTGILKHKIVDQLRRHGREQGLGSDGETDGDERYPGDAEPDEGSGSRRDDPESVLARAQLRGTLLRCIEELPGRQGQALMMRDWHGLEADEICSALQVSQNHLWVMLHRARQRMCGVLRARGIDMARSGRLNLQPA